MEHPQVVLAMRRAGWRGGLTALSLAAVLPLAAAAASPSPVPDARFRPALGRDQVVIGYPSLIEPTNIGKHFSDLNALAIVAAIFTIDVKRDSDWKPFPEGVAYLPTIRDGTWRLDGKQMVLTWRIRPRRWHDGRAVTCGDYVFSHQVARDERVPISQDRKEIARIASVTCPRGAGGTEIVVRWAERNARANFVQVVHFGPLPRHVLEPVYRRNPARLAETYGVDPQVTIGDGPYRFVEWRKGQSITVEAIPNHQIFGTPAIRRVTWRFLPPPRGVTDALLEGTVDAGIVNLTRALELRGQSGLKVLIEEALFWEHIDFNLDNPLLRDLRVRRAIAHAINRTQLSQQIFQGLVPVSHSYLPRKHPAYTEAVLRYPYDPARARALLRDAGYVPGPDGVLQNAAGHPLALEFISTQVPVYRLQVQRVIQQQLRQVGIEVVIENFPTRVLFSDWLPKRRFKALAMYSWVMSPSETCDGLYTSDSIPSPENNWMGNNLPGYRNLEMDRLCKEAAGELDEARRIALLKQTAVIFSRELPALPLFSGVNQVVVKTGLENFTANPLGGSGFESWNIHKWRWR